MNTIRGSEFTPWMSSRSFLSMSFIISTFSSRRRRAKEFFLAHSPATMPELPTRWSVIFLNGFSLRSLCVKLRPQLRPHARSPHGTILTGVRCYERRDFVSFRKCTMETPSRRLFPIYNHAYCFIDSDFQLVFVLGSSDSSVRGEPYRIFDIFFGRSASLGKCWSLDDDQSNEWIFW